MSQNSSDACTDVILKTHLQAAVRGLAVHVSLAFKRGRDSFWPCETPVIRPHRDCGPLPQLIAGMYATSKQLLSASDAPETLVRARFCPTMTSSTAQGGKSVSESPANSGHRSNYYGDHGCLAVLAEENES
jgi:hypothetical protein